MTVAAPRTEALTTATAAAAPTTPATAAAGETPAVESSTRTYGINELAERFGLHQSTLRYYEKMGLLVDVTRDANGQRVYTDKDVKRLEAIQCFKNGGLPIVKIREFFQYDDDLEHHIDDIIKLVADHEHDLTVTIATLRHDLRHIHQKTLFYHGIKRAIAEGREWPEFEDYEEQAAREAERMV